MSPPSPPYPEVTASSRRMQCGGFGGPAGRWAADAIICPPRTPTLHLQAKRGSRHHHPVENSDLMPTDVKRCALGGQQRFMAIPPPVSPPSPPYPEVTASSRRMQCGGVRGARRALRRRRNRLPPEGAHVALASEAWFSSSPSCRELRSHANRRQTLRTRGATKVHGNSTAREPPVPPIPRSDGFQPSYAMRGGSGGPPGVGPPTQSFAPRGRPRCTCKRSVIPVMTILSRSQLTCQPTSIVAHSGGNRG